MTDAAPSVLAALKSRGWTIAAAESLTGGLLMSALVDVPGASASLRGGVVAYASDLKVSLLGVDADLVTRVGVVDADVALQMALGARRVGGADVGIATTGVAGPDPQDGKPAGTVYIAVATPESHAVEGLSLTGDRAAIRVEAVRRALTLALDHL